MPDQVKPMSPSIEAEYASKDGLWEVYLYEYRNA